MIRVFIVDDSAVLRQSTKFILESDPELVVVGQASNGAEAITQAAMLKPDVITMDIRMPKVDGLEAIREIMAEHPTPIVVVTGVDLDRESGVSAQATKLGAVSFLKRPDGIASSDYKTFAARLIRQVHEFGQGHPSRAQFGIKLDRKIIRCGRAIGQNADQNRDCRDWIIHRGTRRII